MHGELLSDGVVFTCLCVVIPELYSSVVTARKIQASFN